MLPNCDIPARPFPDLSGWTDVEELVPAEDPEQYEELARPAEVSRVPPAEEPAAPPLDSDRFSAAFLRNYPVTLRFLLSLGAPPDLAEETAQAAWAKGWERRWQLRRPETVGNWVNSIAKNILKNRLRADRRLEALTDIASSHDVVASDVDLGAILNRCSRRDSSILVSYYLEGYTTEEIARQIGLTAVTVRVRLLRLRRALRTQLGRPRTPQAKAA
jgi:RNA polymerase sigma factor (sigma-70 family)